jgi:hypothetical protein
VPIYNPSQTTAELLEMPFILLAVAFWARLILVQYEIPNVARLRFAKVDKLEVVEKRKNAMSTTIDGCMKKSDSGYIDAFKELVISKIITAVCSLVVSFCRSFLNLPWSHKNCLKKQRFVRGVQEFGIVNCTLSSLHSRVMKSPRYCIFLW